MTTRFSLDDDEQQRQLREHYLSAGLISPEQSDAEAFDPTALAPLADTALADVSRTPIAPEGGAELMQDVGVVEPGGPELSAFIDEQAEAARRDLAPQAAPQRPMDVRTWLAQSLGSDEKPPSVTQQRVHDGAPQEESRYPSKVAMWLSGIGSALQRKPWDSSFWERRIAAEDARTGRSMTPMQRAQLANQPTEEDREARRDLMRAQAERMRRPVITDPMAEERRRNAQELAEAREARLAESHRYKMKIDQAERDPSSELSEAARRRAEQMHPELRGKLEGMSLYELNRDPALRAELSKLRIAFADRLTRGRMDKLDAQLTDRQLRKEERDEQRRQREKAEKEEREKERLAMLAAKEVSDEALEVEEFEDLHGDLKIMVPSKYRRDNANRYILSRRTKDVQTADRALAASRRLHELGEMLYSLDGNPLTNPLQWREAEQEYQLFKDEHVGIILAIMGVKGGTEKDRHDIKNLLPERLNPAAVARLKGTEHFIRQQAHEMLRGYGIGVRGLEDHGRGQPMRERPKPQAHRPRASRPTRNDSSQDERATMRTITTRSGKVVQRALTDAEAKTLTAQGFKVE